MCTGNNATASFEKTSLILALCACKLEEIGNSRLLSMIRQHIDINLAAKFYN